ncbi:MAG: PqqD family protein [Limnoraphis sp. WC205]|jgi:hypothetical protein|nr:PqqD family protein [Limnoraphis sp. WC205]
MINDDSFVRINKDMTHSDLEGETVILDLKSGVYYGLNETGTSIWNLIQRPQSVQEIISAILLKYNIEPQLCEQEVKNLLQELANNGLIVIQNEATV